ncbi:Ig-like domain repeat protein, partial [Vibrio alginolyticus]
TVTVTATDEAGNQGTATGTLVIDTMAPAAPVLDATNGSEISGTAEAGSEVQVDVDGDGISDYTTVADGNGDWSITPDTPLADGTTVTATASDEAGNESALATVVVDGVAPIVTVNDATTNDATPTLTGSVDDATASVTVTVDGADYPATNNGDGTWTLADDTLASLADNSYTVTVTATDEAGNQGVASGTLVVDTVGPIVTANDVTTNDTTPALVGTVNDVTANITVTVNGVDYPATNNGDGSWTLADNTLASLADNSYTVTVTATDEAGNQGTATGTLVIDTTAPAAPVLDATNGSEISGSAEAGSEVQVDVDGDGISDYTTVADGNGDWSITPDTPLADGTTVTATATDEAGNQGTATGTLVIDTTAPAAPVLDATNGSEISGSAEAGSEVQVDVDGDGISDYTTVADGNGDWSITPDTPLADGTTVTATASDEAGNESAPATVVVDGVAPIVTVNDATTNDATPTLTGSVDDATASVTVTVDGADYPATNNGDGTWTLVDNTLASLTDNSYTVTVTATDEAGNQGTATGTLVIDTTAPAAPVLDATNGSEISGSAEAGSEVQVDVDGDGISDYTTVADGNGDWSITPDVPLADGTTVTATASDEAGNESAPATVVVDGVAPIVTVNDATTNDATPTLTGSVDDATASVTVTVDGADYPATNNGDGTWTLADDTLASLADNSYTVTVTATDEAGNQGTATGT